MNFDFFRVSYYQSKVKWIIDCFFRNEVLVRLRSVIGGFQLKELPSGNWNSFSDLCNIILFYLM